MIDILLYILKQLMFIYFSLNLPTIAGMSGAGNAREWERVNKR